MFLAPLEFARCVTSAICLRPYPINSLDHHSVQVMYFYSNYQGGIHFKRNGAEVCHKCGLCSLQVARRRLKPEDSRGNEPMCADPCLLTCLNGAEPRPRIGLRGTQWLQYRGGGLCSARQIAGHCGAETAEEQCERSLRRLNPNTFSLGSVEPQPPSNARPHEHGAGRPDEQGRRRGRPGRCRFRCLALAAVSMLAANYSLWGGRRGVKGKSNGGTF